MDKKQSQEDARRSCKRGGMEDIKDRESSGKWTGRRVNITTGERVQKETGRRKPDSAVRRERGSK